MIRVTIQKTTIKKSVEVKNFITKKTTTDKVKTSEYGNRGEPLFDEEYATRDVEIEREVSTTLLIQELEDEQFNLQEVIAAINNLQAFPLVKSEPLQVQR